jgi:hypothetical protein
MTVLAFIFAIFLILLIAFLVTPVSLYLDTAQGRYEVFQRPVFRFFVMIKDETIVPRLQIAGVNIPLQSKREPPPKKKREKSKRKAVFKRSVTAWRFLIDRSLRSFDIKHAVVDLDTDNVVLNAQLIPLFFWASQGPVRLNANFNGRVYVHLEANNRPAKILWILFQFLTKK